MRGKSEPEELLESQSERQGLQRYRRKVAVGRLLLAVALIGVWQFASGRLVDAFFIGSPAGVARVLAADLVDPRFYNDLRVTGIEMGLGYLIGAFGGIALGVLFARWRLAADIVDPYFAALNSLPRIALAPLLIIWFGIDMSSKVVLAATLVFFITFFCTLAGIRSVDPALVDVARLVGASERQIFRYVMLPGAAAWVINGLKMSLPYALIGVIVGEFLVSSVGLGYRLNFYSTSYNTNGTFAMLLVMMALMMVLNSVVTLLERYALRWRPEASQAIQITY
jgi:NitT/TauT family transport system permease protein